MKRTADVSAIEGWISGAGGLVRVQRGEPDGRRYNWAPVVILRKEDWESTQARLAQLEAEDNASGCGMTANGKTYEQLVARIAELESDNAGLSAGFQQAQHELKDANAHAESWRRLHEGIARQFNEHDAELATLRAENLALRGERDGLAQTPLPMVLHCPQCGAQHVDAPEPATGWTNPPHKSHLCHGCGTIWRPASVATNGVLRLDREGEHDTWKPTALAANVSREEG